MLPSLTDAENIFLSGIITDRKHIDYDRVNEIAADYTAYTTGVGIAAKLLQFNMRENKEAFAQRVALTRAVTPDISNSIMNPMFKIGRTPAKKEISWGESNQDIAEKKKRLQDAADMFNGEDSVDDYLKYRLAELDATDPNSFIVVEFEGSVTEKDQKNVLSPYPFEVNSCEAVDYIFDNNILQYLTVKQFITFPDKDGNIKNGSKFTLYIQNNSITATQIDYTTVADFLKQNPNTIPYTPGIQLQESVNGSEFIYLFSTNEESEADRRYFILKVFKHGIPFVPAKRVGIRRDLTTRGRTCVPVMHPAQCYFEKSIKQCSEFDLTNACHTFPQKIQYEDPCPGYKDGEIDILCNLGKTMNGSTCKACNGTGYKIHTSAQDAIIIRMPKDPKDMVNLENMIAYKAPPIDLLRFQKDYGNELRENAIRAVYNSDVFTSQQVAETATSKVIDLDAVYDTLQSFAKNYSNTWRTIMKCIAWIKDVGEGVNIVHQFPVDFKMKSFSALLSDLTVANNTNAPSHVKKAITQDITRLMYLDYPEEIVKIETKDKFFPFPGKTSQEITFIISSDLTPTDNKVLYANFDQIFAELEAENEEFYSLAMSKQQELIDEKVQEIIDELESEDFTNTNIPFVPGGPGAPAGSGTGTGTSGQGNADPNNVDPNNPNPPQPDPNNPPSNTQ